VNAPHAIPLPHWGENIREPSAPVIQPDLRRLINVPQEKMQPMRPTMSDFLGRVMPGDCVQLMAAMPAASVDFVLTDPPYAARYCDRSGRTVTNDNRTAWLMPAFAQIARVLRSNRFCVSFYGWHKVDAFMAAWRAAGLRPRAHFVWIKRYASGQNLAAYCHEQAYLLCKGEPPKPDLVLRDVLAWRYTGNRYHPTQKPLMALRPLIAAYSTPGDIILDPFAGSGTTVVAAKQLRRRYIAMELEARYCKIAQERLSRVRP